MNDPKLLSQAEIFRGKDTDRGKYFSGEIDKYSSQRQEPSCLPEEMTAVFLFAQLEVAKNSTANRLKKKGGELLSRAYRAN